MDEVPPSITFTFNPSPVVPVLTIAADGTITIAEHATIAELRDVLATLAAMYYTKVLFPEQMHQRMKGT